jgi:hypothetical protein
MNRIWIKKLNNTIIPASVMIKTCSSIEYGIVFAAFIS